MIAYSRSLDETIENGKKMPHWMSRSSEKASNYLQDMVWISLFSKISCKNNIDSKRIVIL